MKLPNSRSSMMRSMLLLLMLTPALTACGPAELLRFLGGSESVTIVKIECPQLSPPPDEVVDALAAAKDDPDVAEWVVDLDRHYQKLDTCTPT